MSKKPSLVQVMSAAIREAELDDDEVAAAMGVSPGYFSRLLRRRLIQTQAQRLVLFMKATNSVAPLQWIADQLGCDIVQRDSTEQERAA